MTLTITALVVALVFGVSVGLAGLGIALALSFHQLREDARVIQGEVSAQLYRDVHTAWGRQDLAEKKAAFLEAKMASVKDSIEHNALPWVAKNDNLEARFEADAIDKLDNPVISWDSIPGLGRTD